MHDDVDVALLQARLQVVRPERFAPLRQRVQRGRFVRVPRLAGRAVDRGREVRVPAV